MANKLLIVMINADPGTPAVLEAPLSQAAAAAAMEYEVEVVLGGRAAVLAQPGVAAGIALPDEVGRTVYDLIRDAHHAGVRFKLFAGRPDGRVGKPIPEIEAIVGSAYLVSEAMDDDTVTFTY
ncbi:MAG TPA: peroxiredoxin [Candidatus Competibacteraceae bacterium]|nr:peroxiredoxin [Candidatus Competibacteraceae bacterium]